MNTVIGANARPLLTIRITDPFMCHTSLMATAPGIRARNRTAIENEIMRAASRHLAEYGAAGLSLRAIARDLDMVSSAIYRYVESRDELLTRLIIAAYDSLGSDIESAVEKSASSDKGGPPEHFKVIARATRSWALSNPHEYALIYGSPVPGYHAPAERTNVAGNRVQQQLVRVLIELAPQFPQAECDPQLAADPSFTGVKLSTDLLERGLIAWTLVLGAISAEVFEHFGPDIAPDKAAYFERTLGHAVLAVQPD